MSRFSTASAVASLLAAAAYVRADLAFSDNLKATQINFDVLAPAFDALAAPPEAMAFAPAPPLAFTELTIYWGLLAIAVGLSFATMAFAWLAKRRREPSLRWAWPIVVAYAVLVFALRLVVWEASLITVWLRAGA